MRSPLDGTTHIPSLTVSTVTAVLEKNGTRSVLTATGPGEANEITVDAAGELRIKLTAANTDTLGRLSIALLSEDEILSGDAEKDFMVMAANVYDSLFGSDKLQVDGGFARVSPAGYLGDYITGDTIYFLWRTTAAPSAAGTLKVYVDGNDTGLDGVGAGITDTRNFDSQTNVHLCKIELDANTFYGKQKDFSVVLTGAIIDGNSVNAVIATFSIENRYSGKTFIRQG